jgi:trehalose synthase
VSAVDGATGLATGSLLERYRAVAGAPAMRALEALARRLRGHRLTMVNSTASGGGVAEILHRMVTLLGELGIPTRWEVMPGDARFHAVTKTIHNALHGTPSATLDTAALEAYLETTRRAAASLELDGDLVMIHDPQPAALAALRRARGQCWVWRCHIDLSHADRITWEALAPHVLAHDAAVYSHRAFVPPLPLPAFLVPPSIDPFADKNRELSESELRDELAPLGLPADVPWVTQVSRFDRLKDPLGVVEAFTLTRRRERAHLVLAGGSADDDPEGAEVLAEVRARVAGREDVSVLALPPDAHRTINALQRRSAVVIQKSLREGFALTVAEALWKRRAVVASAVGGIPLQVIHERTGLLVRSVEGAAMGLTRLLRAPDLRRRLGQAGHEHVRESFLHVREARDYLALFAWLLDRGVARG